MIAVKKDRGVAQRDPRAWAPQARLGDGAGTRLCDEEVSGPHEVCDEGGVAFGFTTQGDGAFVFAPGWGGGLIGGSTSPPPPETWLTQSRRAEKRIDNLFFGEDNGGNKL